MKIGKQITQNLVFFLSCSQSSSKHVLYFTPHQFL